MRLKSTGITILILGLFWGIIGLSMMTGFWQTKISAADAIAKTPEDIKGWMTLNDISESFKIPVAELIKICQLQANVDTNKPIKEIAKKSGKETEYYRELIMKYLSREGYGQKISPTASETSTN